MSYLNLDLAYFTHRKTLRLLGLLGHRADVFPLRLWAYVAGHYPESGLLQSYLPSEIEAIIGWRGKPGDAVEALVRVGFLETTPDGFLIHDWAAHEGHLSAFSERARHAAQMRWSKLKPHALSIAQTAPEQSVEQSPVPHPTVPTVPNQPSVVLQRPENLSQEGRCAQPLTEGERTLVERIANWHLRAIFRTRTAPAEVVRQLTRTVRAHGVEAVRIVFEAVVSQSDAHPATFWAGIKPSNRPPRTPTALAPGIDKLIGSVGDGPRPAVTQEGTA